MVHRAADCSTWQSMTCSISRTPRVPPTVRRDTRGRLGACVNGSAGIVARALFAGTVALATCNTTSTAFAFGPGHAARFPATARGRRGAMVVSQHGKLDAQSSRWTGGGKGGVGVVGIAKPILQQDRRKRWRTTPGRSTLRMGSSLEAGLGEFFKAPDERILKAVEKAGNRAVPSDVAALAGVDLFVAKNGLVNLANLVGGDLEVSKDGDVVYNFPSNFRATLLQRSAYRRAVEAVRAAWPLLFYFIRVSFGVVLLSSILLIFSTIMFVNLSGGDENSNNNNNNRGRRSSSPFGGGGGGGFNVFFGPSPFDFFYYRPYYGYYSTPSLSRENPDDMGLLQSIFSYLFGDGDPNADLDVRRVEAAAQLIRDNGGAVAAEQLAPLLTPGNLRPGDSANVDESFVLPIVTALDGAPEVTEDGDIVYVFPSLQTSAVTGSTAGVDRQRADTLAGLKSLSTADLRFSLEAAGVRGARTIFERSELVDAALRAGIAKLPDGRIVRQAVPSSAVRPGSALGAGGRGMVIPDPLEEMERPFSVAPGWKKIAAAVLGVINLGGALYLEAFLSRPEYAGYSLPGYYGFVQGLMPFLLSYAVAFNAIPAFRWLFNKRENAKIEERNLSRRRWAAAAKNGGAVVGRKLKAAKSMATKLRVIKAQDVEYTTAKSLAEQGINTEDDLLDDFDARLNTPKKALGDDNSSGDEGTRGGDVV